MKKTEREAMERAKAEAAKILVEAVERAVAVMVGVEVASKENTLKAPSESAMAKKESLLTEEQVRVALNLPNVFAVRELRQRRKIPFVRLGYRTIRYDLPKVLRALEKLEIKEAGISARHL